MAFDVYVGTMTRFYRNDWENAAQRMCRETGTPYKMIQIGGDPEPPPPADEVRQRVDAWCQQLNAALAPHGCSAIRWNESDDQPYFSERPAWGGYTGLLVWAAHAEHPDLPLPTDLPQSWLDDAAFQRSTAPEFKTRFRTILAPQLWLPVDFPFMFQFPTLVSDDPTPIGSTFTLKRQLDQLHEQTRDQLRSSNATPGHDKQPGFARMADFGLTIFRDLAAKACEHRLPMLLHY